MLNKTESWFCGTMLTLATVLAVTVVNIILCNFVTPMPAVMLVCYILLATVSTRLFGRTSKATALYYICTTLVIISYGILYYTRIGRI